MHFKTEKSYVSADIPWETVIFCRYYACGLFSYIGCAAMLLLGYYRCGLTGKDRTVGYVSRGNLAFLKTEQFLKKVTISPDDTYTGAAPLEFRFVWRDEDSGGESDETVNLRYEWNFSRDAFNDIFLTRF